MKQVSRFLPTLIALIALVPSAAAADQSAPWPPVTPEDLKLAKIPGDAGAPAIILNREVNVDDQKGYEDHYLRYKVLTDAGKEYANVEITYSKEWNEVEGVQARVVQTDGQAADFHGELLKKTLVRKGGFSVDAVVLSLPDVRVGSILEYRYRLRSKFKGPDWLINSSSYIFRWPDSWPSATWVIQRELFTRHARFTLKAMKGHPIQSVSFLGDAYSVRSPNPDERVLEAENIPAFLHEDLSFPDEYQELRIYFYYIVGLGDVNDYWNGYAYQRRERLEQFIGKPKEVSSVLKTVVADGDSPQTKLRKIYTYVQGLRNLSYESQRSDKEQKRENLPDNNRVTDVLKRGYGRGNEINYAFAALARAAGFQANMVALASRDRSFLITRIPNSYQLNSLLVHVESFDKDTPEYYLDPANTLCPFGLLPWEESGVQGLSLASTGKLFVSTPQPSGDDSLRERSGEFRLQPDGTLTGKFKVVFRGQEGFELRRSALQHDAAGKRKLLDDYVKPWFPPAASLQFVNAGEWEKSELPFWAEYSVTVPSFAAAAGHRLLMPGSVFKVTTPQIFDHATREHAMYFDYPYRLQDDVRLALPDGSRLEAQPEPREFALHYGDQDIARFHVSETVVERDVRLQSNFSLNAFFFEKSNFTAMKSFFNRMGAAHDVKLVVRTDVAQGR